MPRPERLKEHRQLCSCEGCVKYRRDNKNFLAAQRAEGSLYVQGKWYYEVNTLDGAFVFWWNTVGKFIYTVSGNTNLDHIQEIFKAGWEAKIS